MQYLENPNKIISIVEKSHNYNKQKKDKGLKILALK